MNSQNRIDELIENQKTDIQYFQDSITKQKQCMKELELEMAEQ